MDAKSPDFTGSTLRPAAWKYGWWLLVGALFGLGIASLLTIGVFLLPVAIILAAVGALMPTLRNSSAVAILAGIALPLLYIAWLNRAGPGTVCKASASEVSCFDTWSPWPFVVVPAVLVVAAIVFARVALRIVSPR